MKTIGRRESVAERRNRHRAQQRQRILLAAARLFVHKGYLGTSINDIANAARVNKAIIYYYFKNKAFLLHEVVSGTVRALIDLATPIANSTLRPLDKLEALIMSHIKWQISHHSRSGIGYIERKNLPPSLLRQYISMRDEYEKIFRTTIEEGIVQGDFQCTDAKLSSIFTLGLINSVILWFKPKGNLSPEELGTKACSFVFEGLKA
jgi:AcrR family transcriptional regulator